MTKAITQPPDAAIFRRGLEDIVREFTAGFKAATADKGETVEPAPAAKKPLAAESGPKIPPALERAFIEGLKKDGAECACGCGGHEHDHEHNCSHRSDGTGGCGGCGHGR